MKKNILILANSIGGLYSFHREVVKAVKDGTVYMDFSFISKKNISLPLITDFANC